MLTLRAPLSGVRGRSSPPVGDRAGGELTGLPVVLSSRVARPDGARTGP